MNWQTICGSEYALKSLLQSQLNATHMLDTYANKQYFV